MSEIEKDSEEQTVLEQCVIDAENGKKIVSDDSRSDVVDQVMKKIEKEIEGEISSEQGQVILDFDGPVSAEKQQKVIESQNIMIKELKNQITHLTQEIMMQTKENDQLKKSMKQLKQSDKGTYLDQTQKENDLEKRCSALQAENEALKKENDEFQSEIGEVLVFARRKTKRTVEEAKMEAERVIRSTDIRIEAIQDKAREVLFEVEETKVNVTHLFDDLQRQLHQLSDKKIMIDDMEYQRLEN
ncbi:hypothetical protein [Enterococcus sp. N249-2]